MDEDNCHHEVRAPSMHCADEPAQSHIVIQSLQAAPCLACRWDVDEGQQNSGDELEKKDGERRAAKYVEPARRVARHWMFGNFANGIRELQATIKPFADLSDHAHVFVFLSKAFVSLEADNLLSMETNSFCAPHGALFPKREAGCGPR